MEFVATLAVVVANTADAFRDFGYLLHHGHQIFTFFTPIKLENESIAERGYLPANYIRGGCVRGGFEVHLGADEGCHGFQADVVAKSYTC